MTGGELHFHLSRIGFNAQGEAIEVARPQPVVAPTIAAAAEPPAADIDIATTAKKLGSATPSASSNKPAASSSTTTTPNVPTRKHRGSSMSSPPVMHRNGFEEEIVKFWAAGLVLAIGYLHSQSIVLCSVLCVLVCASICTGLAVEPPKDESNLPANSFEFLALTLFS